MASKSKLSCALDEVSRNHLECWVCLDKYKQPKILDCLHSFCEQCLVKYRRSEHPDTASIPCPVCRKETRVPESGVPGLKTNFHLVSLAEEISWQEKVAGLSSKDAEVTCEICREDNQASHYCVDCQRILCDNCLKMHLRIPVSRNHNISKLEDIRLGKGTSKIKQEQSQQKCSKHVNELARFFCTTCEQLICRDCTVVDHCKPKHTYIDTSTACSTYKQKLAELTSSLEKNMLGMKESKVKFQSVERELADAVGRTVKEVQDRSAVMRAEITAQETCIISGIEHLKIDREKRLKEYEKLLGVIIKRMEHSLEISNNITKIASEIDFLSLYSTVSKDVKSLGNQPIPRLDSGISFLNFRQGLGVADFRLGMLKTQESKFGRRRCTRKSAFATIVSVVVLFVAVAIAYAVLPKCRTGEDFFEDFCYYVSDTKSTWGEGQRACEDRESKLATVGNLETNDFIGNLMKTKSVESAWIGLKCEDEHTNCDWLNRPAESAHNDYRNWGMTLQLYRCFFNYDECCAVMDVTTSYKWTAGPCDDETHNYICHQRR